VLINNKVEGSGTAWLFSVYAGEKLTGRYRLPMSSSVLAEFQEDLPAV
jgi:hypothetical protein